MDVWLHPLAVNVKGNLMTETEMKAIFSGMDAIQKELKKLNDRLASIYEIQVRMLPALSKLTGGK